MRLRNGFLRLNLLMNYSVPQQSLSLIFIVFINQLLSRDKKSSPNILKYHFLIEISLTRELSF